METHAKKRLEIIVEGALTDRVIDQLESAGAPGYTVFEGVRGRGHAGRWRRDQLSDAYHMNMIIVILDESRLDALLGALQPTMASHLAIVDITDAKVLRGDRF